MDRRRLRDRADQTLGFGVRELRRPVGAKTLAMHEDAVLVDLAARGEIVEHARIDLVGGLIRLARRLSGAGTVDGEESDAFGNGGRIGLGDGFLAAVET